MNEKEEILDPAKEIVSFWQGFKEFLSRYSVLGLAVAFVAGEAVNNLVQAIVKGIITPILQLLMPGEGFNALVIMIGGVPFDLGVVLDAFLRFFIILLLVYLLVKHILRDETLLPIVRR